MLGGINREQMSKGIAYIRQTLDAFGKRLLDGLSRWWDRGIWYRLALFAVIPVLAICACCSGFTVFAFSPQGQALVAEQNATATAQTARANATATRYAFLHPAPTATPVLPTSTPSPQPTATPTSTPVPTATATPRPTATSAPQWTTVNTFTGNGISNTPTFIIGDAQWRIAWSCNPSAYGSSYNLIAELVAPGNQYGDLVVNVICKKSDPSSTSGQTMQYVQGTYYLKVNSEASWIFKIQALR